MSCLAPRRITLYPCVFTWPTTLSSPTSSRSRATRAAVAGLPAAHRGARHLLAYEATRNVKVSPIEITTPVTTTMGVKISEPRSWCRSCAPVSACSRPREALLPTAEVGFLGMVRDETTFEPTTYAERLPDDLSDRQCFAIDPMLATGGSLAAAIQFLFDRGART